MSRKKKHLMDWAQFRFSIIGSLLARPPAKGELRMEIEKLASRRFLHPVKEKWMKFGASTLERWYYKALNTDDPIRALGRKIRSDAGVCPAMNSQLINALGNQYKDYSDWSYQLHADNLSVLVEEQPDLGPMPSYSTVRRRMKERGWIKKRSHKNKQTIGQKRALERLEQREVRSFEASHVHALWHLDFHHARRRVLDSKGQWHTPVVLCILDDYSRLCCHIQWYLNETAHELFHGLMQAFHKRGLPRSLMTDNGPAMIAHETKNGLSSLGVLHETTLPYSPYQNGKQEAFWGQLEGRLMAMLSKMEPLSLQFLNRCSQAWAEQEYNRSYHEEIKTTPLDRMLNGKSVGRPSRETESIKLAFTDLFLRTQRKSDQTISINGIRFEVPSRFKHFERLHVRCQQWDLTQAYLVAPGTNELLARIYPQDKSKNANGYRRTLSPSSDSLPSGNDVKNPIPPLLRKILSDYAATGLPPAYIVQESNKEG